MGCDARLTLDDSGRLGLLGDRFSTVSAQSNPSVSELALSSVREDRLQRRRAAQRNAEPDSDRAASYSRFSSDMQRTESNADQQRTCRDAAERNSHIITTEQEYADEGISGTKRRRAGLSAMLAAAERGEFATLYIYSLSRLARESIITLPLLKKLVFTFKVRVISVSDGIDSAVTNWELIAAIMSFVSEQFLRDLKAAVLRGQEGIVLALLCVGDYCFGYRSEPIPGSENTRRGRNPRPRKVYVFCEDTAAWVERIFLWFVVDNWTISEIARELTRCHVRKDHRSTNPVWSTANVRSILENEKYIGRWNWGTMENDRDPETGQISQKLRDEDETEKWKRLFPDLRLIKDELFARTQKKLRENAEYYAKTRDHKGRLQGSTGDRRGQVLLSGLIECGICGSKFVCAGKRVYCPNRPKGHCSCATGLKRELAERLILDQIGELIRTSPEWLSELENSLLQVNQTLGERALNEVEVLRRQLIEAESRRENLLRLAEDGDLDPDLKKRLAARRQEIREIRDRLQQFESKQTVIDSAPTRDSLMADLENLAGRLQGSAAAAGEVLRGLLGGKIVVEEVIPNGARHGFLRGTLQVRVYDVCQTIGRSDGMDSHESSAIVTHVIDFLDPDPMTVVDELQDRAWALYAEGRLAKEISGELGVNRNRVMKMLKEVAADRGEKLIDGRTRRSNLARKHLAPPLFQALAPSVMKQFHRGDLYSSIASTLKIDINTVRKSVNWWHHQQGLAAPDGRSRRLQLDAKCRK